MGPASDAAPGGQDDPFGQQSMRERVKRNGEKLAIKNAPGKGTVISARLSGVRRQID